METYHDQVTFANQPLAENVGLHVSFKLALALFTFVVVASGFGEGATRFCYVAFIWLH